jgi:AraC-like DNA-binding protein
MVRRIQVEAVDDVPRPIIAVGNDYPDGHLIAPHRHRRGQLISGASGMIVLGTRHGTWVMPPQRGMWIPPETLHDVRIVGAVSLQSLYLEPDLAGGLPDRCQVVGITPFLRGLIAEALDLPAAYELDSRAGALMTLLQHEVRCLVALPLWLPHPSHAALAERCLRFIRHPDVHQSIADWSVPLGMSRRAFTRLFRRETGFTFMEWRQQACLLAALPRLASGEPVTTVALSLGYDNPAAFTTMFKRLLGASPRAYFRHGDGG